MAAKLALAGNVPFFVPYIVVAKEVATLNGQSQSKVNLNHFKHRHR
jgi:hypothetical protein